MTITKFLIVVILLNILANIVLLTIDAYTQKDWSRLSAVCGWSVALVGYFRSLAYEMEEGE